jgi:hypothetical protein
VEYVALRAVHPSWLTMQLPQEIAELLQYQPESGKDRTSSRTIAFLSRGPGVLRVLAAQPGREVVAIEQVRNRLLANARPGDRLLFNLPAPVLKHLGTQVYSRGPKAGRGTADSLLWLMPAPEYYEYRATVDREEPWKGPSAGPFAHVYLTKSLLPLPKAFEDLADIEYRIEEEEWRPGVAALQRVGRLRRPL